MDLTVRRTAVRRRPLSLLAALLATLLSLLVPAGEAAAAECATPAVERFGPASLTGAVVGATVHDGRGYVVTRGLKPPVLAEYDLATRTVVRQVVIPDMPTEGEIEGAWATVESGGKIYIGTYIVPDLYRFDPATGEMEHLASFGGKGGFVWSLAAAPDGKIYAGTYPDGKVWEYNPAGGAVRGFATVTGENNVRSVAVDSTYVYAGLLDSKRLISVNRSTGAVKTLAQGDGGFATVALGRTRVRAGSGTKLYDVKTDGTDLRVVELGGSADAIGHAPDYTAYVSTRPRGAVYRYRTAEPLVELGAPRAQEETRRLHLDGATLTGFTGSGGVWTMDVGTHATTSYTDLIAAGLTPGTERPQSILLDTDRGNVWVAGHYAITVHHPDALTRTRVWVPGEPKALTRHGDKIYAAMYPSGEIVELDAVNPETPLRSLGYLGSGQQRPWDMEYDPVSGKLLVASAPLGTALNGALSVVDPSTGAKDVYLGVIRDQSLLSLSLGSDGIVYLGGDTWGGGTGTPTRTAASIAAFDLTTRTVKWEVTPIAQNASIQDVKVHDGVLYGVTKRAKGWFTMNLATRAVTAKGAWAGYGEIQVHRGQVFSATNFGGGVHLMGPSSATPAQIATGLGDEWYTVPDLAFEPNSWRAFTLADRDLARIRLEPGCPVLNVATS